MEKFKSLIIVILSLGLIISHFSRRAPVKEAINPPQIGIGGGPLLSNEGEVIGINLAVARGAENLGFAIPVNKQKVFMESLEVIM